MRNDDTILFSFYNQSSPNDIFIRKRTGFTCDNKSLAWSVTRLWMQCTTHRGLTVTSADSLATKT